MRKILMVSAATLALLLSGCGSSTPEGAIPCEGSDFPCSVKVVIVPLEGRELECLEWRSGPRLLNYECDWVKFHAER